MHGGTVEIPFSEEQYRSLLKLVAIGEWVAHALQDEQEDDEFSRVEQYVYSFAGRFGANDLVVKERGRYYPARNLEESTMPLIEEYDLEGFWDTLVDLLAARDLATEHGEDGVRQLPGEEFLEQLNERASVYEEEFEEYGVERLQIVEE
jgi:hypothetical protein